MLERESIYDVPYIVCTFLVAQLIMSVYPHERLVSIHSRENHIIDHVVRSNQLAGVLTVKRGAIVSITKVIPVVLPQISVSTNVFIQSHVISAEEL